MSLLASAAAIGGCSIAGSWKTVAVDPPDARFPLDHVTFDRDNNYTATWSENGKTRTATGQYQWNWSKLEIVQTGRPARAYRTRHLLDGRLVLTFDESGAKASATLERVDK